jgi:hypothetical protein
MKEFCSQGSLHDVMNKEGIQFNWQHFFKIAIEAVK